MGITILAQTLLEFSRCRRLPYLNQQGEPPAPPPPLRFQLNAERQALVQAIAQEYPGEQVEAGSRSEAIAITKSLMAAEADLIYDGVLCITFDEITLISQPPLLMRQPEGGYLPVEVRTGKRLKPEYSLAVGTAGLALNQSRGFVILRDRRWQRVQARLPQVKALCKELVAVLAHADLPHVHMKRDRCQLCAWQPHCRHLIAESQPLLLLPGLAPRHLALLEDEGIHTLAELAAARSLPEPLNSRLIAQAQATLSNQAVVLRSFTVPSAPVELYFDIEAAPDCVYLLGVVVVKGDQREYVACLAETPTQEEQAWQNFLALVDRYPDAPIFHFHIFEVQTCRQLAQRYHTPRSKLKQLEARMVDLHAVVTQNITLPTEGYSLKAIARWLEFQWRDAGASGAQSLVWYAQWQATGDSEILATTLRYNEDDCLATYRLKDWLAKLEL